MTPPDSAQLPLDSGFSSYSTAADVVAGIDLSGRTAIVTGGHAGIGLPTVRALRGAGAEVIVPVRDLAKGCHRLTGLDVEIDQLDLSSPPSIDNFVDRFLASGRALDVIIGSAGVMGVPLHRDGRGLEQHFATNHLGHFQLVRGLWPALRAAGEATGQARVVLVSAWAHRLSPVVFDDPQYERRAYEPFQAYGQSKTANVLTAVAVERRGHAEGIHGFALHPGSIVGTDLSGWATPESLRASGLVDDVGRPIIDPPSGRKTVDQGAATSVWCATSPLLDNRGGVYCENSDVSPLIVADAPAFSDITATPVGVAPHAVDVVEAERLWNYSEKLLVDCR
jgi:NAD(P)-dependent dehydrogenase (short-subunit alcohol dehydrogenase family)